MLLLLLRDLCVGRVRRPSKGLLLLLLLPPSPAPGAPGLLLKRLVLLRSKLLLRLRLRNRARDVMSMNWHRCDQTKGVVEGQAKRREGQAKRWESNGEGRLMRTCSFLSFLATNPTFKHGR
jgi:hypothetical protein